MYDVVALGELLIDFTQTGIDDDGYPSMAAHPGGAPANYLATIAKFGGTVAMISAVGRDDFGDLLVDTLTKAGVDTRGVQRLDDYFTTLAFVRLDKYGDRSFSFARKPGADTQIAWQNIDITQIDNAKAVHFGTLSLTHPTSRRSIYSAVAYAKEKNKLISFDPNLRFMLWDDLDFARDQMYWGFEQANVVKLSEEELRFALGEVNFEDGVSTLHQSFGVDLVMLTLGADGCIVSNGNFYIKHGALKHIDVVDTTGAGDIFGGSAMWWLLKSRKLPCELSLCDLTNLAKFACASAGQSTTKYGGIQSVPSLEEIKNICHMLSV